MSSILNAVTGDGPSYLHSVFGRSISSSVLSGDNPTHVDPSNPITLFIIQLVIIIVFTQTLGWGFSYVRQPKVIAEVVGGIILGPTVMGRIPGFTQHIFPQPSLTYLNLVSTIGLILFLFLVGLEVDVGVMKKNGRASLAISAAGMILPFGLGAAVAVPVYHNFVETEKVSFGHFLLFVGVAMAITAFPVLCRILTSTKLLDTRVGVMVLAAGVGNDVVGWVLLALTLALVNAKSGVTAVYVLLCAVGWSIVLLWPIKKGFLYLARRTGSIDHGPTPFMMMLTLVIVFTSAFVTGIIGVHPIFGGFIAGLIIPHEGGFAIALVEKIDDLVTMLFLPIYFVLSGLQTNLGLLDTGKIWGYTILLIFIAFFGKFIGCAAAALAMRYPLRESAAIGMLMSCKGLVELIVLNVGLSAGIIDQRLFSMFVVMAIILTFVTTPGTIAIYPEKYRVRISESRKHAGTGDAEKKAAGVELLIGGSGGREHTSKFLVILQKLEHLSAVMLLTQMLEPPAPTNTKPWSAAEAIGHEVKGHLGSSISDESTSSTPEQALARLPSVAEDHDGAKSTAPRVDALKLIELTGRTFSVMQSAEKDQLLLTDDALQLFKQFGRLRGLEITPHISIVGQDSFPQAVADHASDLGTELVIVPWTVPVQGSSSELIEPASTLTDGLTSSTSGALSQFDTIFGSETAGSPMYTHFVRRVFSESPSDIALFVDRGFGSSATFAPGAGQHIFLPFFGGPDDRLALRFVVQLCKHSHVTATIVRVEKAESVVREESEENANGKITESIQIHQAALQSNMLTVGGNNTQYAETQAHLASDTADNIAWTYYTASSTTPPRPASIDSALSRIAFWSTQSSSPLHYAFTCASSAITSTSASAKSWRPMLIVTGRGRRGAAMNHNAELNRMLADKALNPSIGAELRKTVGDPATAMILGGGAPGTASFLVMEAGKA
ncbi:hypothetical protein CI109_105661 [Kwoniella shandongensis]|uniref:Cation/H+ exchanger transmembrane domain-containing protein n=1 Tax=Kwoniella shandongensis TaxID=1734106 RepID=A0A5M6C1I4_9TREE|nr:uncharacterized protein CI109_003002 [Kwoniella shandongensis]KAA5528470.1 hypothetical protein CI109_003002 [Kwoniella shandongensis]